MYLQGEALDGACVCIHVFKERLGMARVCVHTRLQGEALVVGGLLSSCSFCFCPVQSYQNQQAGVAGVAGGQQEEEDSSDSEAADSPSSDERRIIESPPHRY